MGRRRYRHRDYRSSSVKLDSVNKKIGGVCAGIANHFGWSSFTVRLLTILALLTMPHFAIPAYIIAYLILDKEESSRTKQDDLSDEIYDL